MPRRARISTGGLAYHILNRRVGRLGLFDKPADYMAFEKILNEAHERTAIRIAVYCLMPNHWHLVLWPRDDGELSEVMRWITVTHTQRWHAHRQSFGSGPVYQGRFRSFPVQTDEHFLTVARYVERNAVRAKLVKRAEQVAVVESVALGAGRAQAISVSKRLAGKAAATVGGLGESSGDGERVGGLTLQCAARTPFWQSGLGGPYRQTVE